jgi:hypothetical protein
LRAGDDHGDLRLVDDPAQGELRHRHTFGNQGAQPIHRLQTHVERHPGERLADVECLAVAIEVAVIVRGERRAMLVAAAPACPTPAVLAR